MAKIENNGDPEMVPLVYYDEFGTRHVVGEAAVQIKGGEVIAVGKIKDAPFDVLTHIGVSVSDLALSNVVSGLAPSVSAAEESARRLGPLSMENREYVTANNPNGEVRQCDRRDLHEPHEWQAEFGGYFDVYCPGNQGEKL